MRASRLKISWPWLAAAGLVVVVVFGLIVRGSSSGSSGPTASLRDHPNIVFFLTDDQRAVDLSKMPWLRKRKDFTKFTNLFTNNSQCCPSRAGMMSGLYDHHNGVESNGLLKKFDDSNMLPNWLDKRGYDTALFGKYLNGWTKQWDVDYTPPGWDHFEPFITSAYYDYDLVKDGVPVRYGHKPRDFSNNVIADKAVDYINDHDSSAFFLYVAPYGPHGPAKPAHQDKGSFADHPVKFPPNFNKTANDVAPFWHKQELQPRSVIKRKVRNTWENIQSLDRGVQHVYEALKEKGELNDTIFIFASDNGFSFGSHRWKRKACSYDECNRVPLLIRDPAHLGGKRHQLVTNMDISTTIADYADAATGPVDGVSLKGLVAGKTEGFHDNPVLLHHLDFTKPGLNPPTYWGLRSHDWELINNEGAYHELYNVKKDPYELRNLYYSNPRRAKLMFNQLKKIRRKQPVPFDGNKPVQIRGSWFDGEKPVELAPASSK